MTDYAPPTLSDEDVDVLIEWLSQRKEITGKGVIGLIIQALSGLKQDRFLLTRKLKELENV